MDMPTRSFTIQQSATVEMRKRGGGCVCKTYQGFDGAVGIIHDIAVEAHDAGLEEEDQRAAAEFEVAELFGAVDVFAGLARDDGAADHHGADADDHHAPVGDGVDGHDVAYVFAVDV